MNNIPDILTTISGQKITDKFQWRDYRREEILNLFCEYVYGVRDIERPENMKFTITEETLEYDMRVKKIECSFDDFSFWFKLYLPKKQEKPLPAFVYVMHENLQNNFVFDEKGNMSAKAFNSELPLKDITDRGFAIAVMPTRHIYYDWNAHAEFKKGIFAAVKTPKGRQKNSWATISAWAWGVSRVVDYLETDDDINRALIASIGHSRSGKTALWAAATDIRIKLAVPNNSGCMGASLLRAKKGEHLRNITVTDWFCEKLKDYTECEELLPVDQHMLLSLVAPRYLYVTGSVKDEHADPNAEFLSAKLASKVYELHNYKGLVTDDEMPVLNKIYQEGRIAFHVKDGGHSQTKFDWDNVMDYFEKICNGKI